MIFDAIPHTLKHRTKSTLRTFLSAGFLYLSYLSSIGSPLLAVFANQTTTYGLATIGGLLGLNVMNRRMRGLQEVSRLFLLKSCQEVRIENENGHFIDVPIEQVTLALTNEAKA